MPTLKAALQEACFMELEDIPSEEMLSTDETLSFSPAFEKKMKKLIRRADHPIRHRVAQAAACLLLAALLGGTVLAISPEARAAFVGWFREIYDTYFVYRYYGETQSLPEDVIYRPSWLPEGYRIVSENIGNQIYILYESEDGEPALFVYARASESFTLNIDRDGHEISQSVFVGDIPADLYIDQDADENNILIWTDERKGLVFYISAQLDSSEIIKMAESVEAQEIPMPQTIYRPIWIPDGFTESRRSESGDPICFIYEDESGNSIMFAYTQNVESSNLYVEQNEVDVQIIQIGDLYADLYLDQKFGGTNSLVWNDMGTLFLLYGNCSGDELIKIAESVTAQEVPEQEVS